ncbi:MAG: epoxide hydrolase N-terminal domain-containing protein, partial [Chitinophagaceae bacterium]
MKLKPYSIDIQQNILEDLRLRLINMRWPDEIQDAEWSYGTNLIYLQQLVKYWQKEYDWREEERKLNRLNHYKASVNGLGIHFIYERGRSKN